ncbi:cytochrome P450 2C23-like isoform X2 [Anolis sagrei]|uniref:cytochrome P450 2C23-like isoform X2 n=1 Tax=Anolis sagrei TaxID=38937 RepID=UPI0035205556
MEPLGTCTALLLIGIISFLLLSAIWNSKVYRKGRMPPGPTPLPIIGNVLQLKGKLWDQVFSKFREKYGPVFTLYLGTEPVVVLHGYEAIKEALIDQGNDFSDRPNLPLAEKARKGRGIIFSNGESWQQIRRFTLTTLRNFGMGKKSIEERIQEEARYLLEQFHGTKGQPFDPHHLITCATSSVICSILFGKHYGYDDKMFQTLIALLFENIEVFTSIWGQEKHDDASEFTMENMVACCIDLFSAGTETTSSTLKYGLLILQKYPEIEEKVQEEIDRVVGCSRMPSMADRGQMPYTDAVIHEIQRSLSIASAALPHAMVKDTPFRGYVIPKGTTIFPVLISVLHDSKEFPNPKEFDPEHFLNEDGTFKKSDYFMPFSAGKRICTGEGLARMKLFLFFTSILQNFKLKPITDPEDIDATPLVKPIIRFPRPYKFCVIPR